MNNETSDATGMPWTRCRQCGQPDHGSIPCYLAAYSPAQPASSEGEPKILGYGVRDRVNGDVVMVRFDTEAEAVEFAEGRPVHAIISTRDFLAKYRGQS